MPAAFENEWAPTMDAWGTKLMQAVSTVAEMLAIGLHLPKDAIRERLHRGPHLLAPTGSDISQYDQAGATIAGYHYDLNILTIHGRSRYPGLYVWTRQGNRLPVVVPNGCLLIQAGIQLEHLTAGLIQKGMHEVVVTEQACQAARRASEEGRCVWRVSSTLFAHVRSDASLDPLGRFSEGKEAEKYKGVRAGEQVANELKAIELSA